MLRSYHFEGMRACIAVDVSGICAFGDDRGAGLANFVDGVTSRELEIGGGFFSTRSGGLGGMADIRGIVKLKDV